MQRFLIFAVLFCFTSPSAGTADDHYERFLDPSLKVLYRAQQGTESASRTQAEALLTRLHAPESLRTKGASTDRLNLVIKFRGDQSRLMDAEFAIDSCVGSICTGSLPVDRLPDLVKITGIHFVQLSRPIPASVSPSSTALTSQIASTAVSGQGQSSPTKDAGGTGALIAFIDTGVDIFHQDFRLPGGETRIKLLLDFSDPGDVDGDGILDGAGPFGGTLYNETEINAALVAGSFASTDPTGHGTHGLSIAAGDDTTTPGMAPSADLIVVKGTREDGSLGFYSADIINALSWVDEQATLLTQPYVVNLSLGSTFCSHDGRSLEEQAVDALVGPGVPGKAAVIAAGNASANRSSHFNHFTDTAYVGLDSSHTLTVPAYTPIPDPGNDRILVDIWYEGRDELAISVTGPASCGSPVITADFGHYEDQPTACGDVFIANMGGANPLNGDMEAIVLIDDWSGTPPEPGDWTINFTGEAIGDDGVYHGWLAEESMVGETSPYLSANADNRFLVGTPGGAVNGITVGSYALHDASAGSRFLTSWTDVNGIGRTDSSAVDGDISDFSSPGPTRDGRVKPDLAAPGERVMGAVSQDAWPGVSPVSIYQYHPWPEADALIVDEVTEHGFGMLQGTSFAAPVVAGLAARLLSTDPTLDAIQVRNMLINTAAADGTTGDVPSDEWGYGKADQTVGTSTSLPSDLRITIDHLPDGYVGEQYNVVLTASGGTLPYSWSVTSGSLPDGVELQPNGYLGGIPVNPNLSTMTVSVTDSGVPSQETERTVSIQIWAETPLAVLSNSLSTAQIGQPYSMALQAEGGVAPYSWSVAGGDLPAGLSLDSNGLLSGIPTQPGRAAFSVLVSDGESSQANGNLLLMVSDSSNSDWSALGSSRPDVIAIAVDPIDPDQVYCSASGAIFASSDRGLNWQNITHHNDLNHGANQIEISPISRRPFVSNGGICFPVPDPYNLYPSSCLKYYDSATGRWHTVVSPPLVHGICDNCLTDTGTKFFSFEADQRLYVDSSEFDGSGPYYYDSLFVSDDEGENWTLLEEELSWCFDGFNPPCPVRIDLTVFSPNNQWMYVTDEKKVKQSQDGGAGWANVTNNSGGGFEISVSQNDEFDVFLLNTDLWQTTDGGRNWGTIPVPDLAAPRTMLRSNANPAHIHLADSQGIHKSVDAGTSWERLPIRESDVSDIAIFAADPDLMYAATSEGAFVSDDGGLSWEDRSSGLLRRRMNFVKLSPSSPTDLLLRTEDGLFLSRSGGRQWTYVDGNGLPSSSVSRVIMSGANPDVYYLFWGTRPFFSQDRGLSWAEFAPDVYPGEDLVAFDADPFDANTVLMSFAGTRGTYRSRDGGDSWEPVNNGLPFSEPSQLVFSSNAEGRAFIRFGGDLFQSDDRGTSWTLKLTGGSTDTYSFAPSNDEYIYSLSGSTIQFFDPLIGTWQTATVGPPLPVFNLAIDPNDPQVAFAGADHPGGAEDTGGIFATYDGGRNWAEIPGPLDQFDVVSVTAHPVDSGVLWAATGFGGVYKTIDGGATWEGLNDFGTIADLTNLSLQDPTNEFLLFAGTEGYGVQASTDGGATFEPRVNGLTNYYVNAMSFDPDDPTVLYAGTDAGVFKTTDSANTWVPTDLIAGAVTDIVADNEGTARRIWVTVAGEGVAYSGDGSASFTMYETGLASLEVTSIEIEDLGGTARRIWVTTHGGDGVAYSDDLGQSWTSAAGNGLTDRDVNDLLIDGVARRIWVTTNTGVFHSDNDGLSWNELSYGLPSDTPVTSVSMDPNTSEVFVSLFSDHGGGVYRGANFTGSWRDFSGGLRELRVKKLTNDGGAMVRRQGQPATRFFAATRGRGVFAADVFSLTGLPPSIQTTTMSDGVETIGYQQFLEATGGSQPYTWVLGTGALPPGLTLDPPSGEIAGAPARYGLYTFSVRAVGANLQESEQELQILVHRFAGHLFWDDFETGNTSRWSLARP